METIFRLVTALSLFITNYLVFYELYTPKQEKRKWVLFTAIVANTVIGTFLLNNINSSIIFYMGYAAIWLVIAAFAKIGLGYNMHFESDMLINGFFVEPGIGWKIDVGKEGGFFIEPSAAFPVRFGVNSSNKEFEYGFGFIAQIAFGCKF